MASLIKAILEVFSELTVRRFLSLLAIIVVLGGTALIYERMTASFTLSKIEKEIDVLGKLDALRSSTNNHIIIEKMRDQLAEQLQMAISAEPFNFKLVASPIVLRVDGLWKFFAAAAPWFLLGFVAIKDSAKKGQGSGSVFFGATIMALFSGLIGVAIPTRHWPYFNLIIYPILSVAAFGFFVAILVSLAAKKK